MSIFHTPHIKSVQENNNSLIAEIFSKSNKCGKIHISDTNFTYNISCGLKIGKGLLEIDKVCIEYKKERLILFSTIRPQKKLLEIKCSQDIFESINSYISKKKSSSKDSENNKSFLLDND